MWRHRNPMLPAGFCIATTVFCRPIQYKFLSSKRCEQALPCMYSTIVPGGCGNAPLVAITSLIVVDPAQINPESEQPPQRFDADVQCESCGFRWKVPIVIILMFWILALVYLIPSHPNNVANQLLGHPSRLDTMKHSPRLHIFVYLISASLSQCLAVDYRYFVAGGVCAAYSHGITTPIDVIKTKMQADPKEFNAGMLSAAAKIVKKDGPGVLLGGLGPTVVGYGIEGAAKFGIYEILKPVFGKIIDDQPTAFILASIAAGAVAALILCPAESVRIRIVTDKDYAGKGLISGLPKLIKDEGFLEMFGGFPAMITKQVRCYEFK